MRFLVRATIPMDAGNALVHDPNFGKRMEDILSDIKPEATYFCAEGGQRTLYCVVNIDDISRLPAIAEPLWLSLKASVDFIPALTQEDFAKAAPSIEQAAKKY